MHSKYVLLDVLFLKSSPFGVAGMGAGIRHFSLNKVDNPSEAGVEMRPNAASAPTLGRRLSGRGSGVARDGGSGH